MAMTKLQTWVRFIPELPPLKAKGVPQGWATHFSAKNALQEPKTLEPRIV